MLYLKRNVPGWERFIRIAAGLAAAGLAYAYAQGTIGMWIGIAGGVMFAATGLVGYCPMCAVAGRKPVELPK
jgi:Inner membrane protein YgaP-like, transmembrane domain